GVDGEGLAFEQAVRLAQRVTARIGHPEWACRIMGMTFKNVAQWMAYETDADPFGFDASGNPLGLPFVLGHEATDRADADYLDWILNADLDALKNQNPPAAPRALLHLLLRHSALLDYRTRGLNVMVAAGAARVAEYQEREFTGSWPGMTNSPTIWQRFEQQVPGTSVQLKHLVFQSRKVPDDPELPTFFESVEFLKGLAPNELQRLCAETLDLCSHRIDAWITSLAARRLWRMRNERSGYFETLYGSYVGAYGWEIGR